MSTSSGLETVGGIGDKLQTFVHFPVLMRILLPGALTTAVVFPFTGLRREFNPAELSDVWPELLIMLILVFVLGSVISALNGQVYKIYEGRIFWPQWLFDWFRSRQSCKIDFLLKNAKRAKTENRESQYNELWNKLRIFPVDGKGDPQATNPTILGNILAGYEDYPKTRYGMDSVFYWPRLWLEIDKDIKKEIDGKWSLADGFLSLSAVSFLGGVLWLWAAAFSAISPFYVPLPLDSPSESGFGGFSLVVISYCLYKLSLPFHRNNGETFKAIFDLYRDKLNVMTRIGPQEFETWNGTWSYLQYLRVFCLNCKKYFPAHLVTCEFCKHPTAESLRQIKRMADSPRPNEV